MNINQFEPDVIGKKMSGDEIRAFQIHSLALGALINDAVFEDEFDKINFKIDENIIALKTKERIPQLYDSKNNLNEVFLNSFLQNQQLKIEDIVQIINYETRNEYFDNAFFKVNYPKIFVNKINSFNNHKREVNYIELDLDQISIDEIMPDAEELNQNLTQFYNQNISNYMSKEKRDVEYIIVDKNEIKENFIPTNLEIKNYYDLNKKLFFKNETRSFIQFNFKDKKEALNFKENINFLDTDSIIKYSKDNNIKFNEFKKIESSEILEEIAESLFKLNLDEKSDVIETTIAKHILILQSIEPSYQMNLSEVEEKIKSTISEIESKNYYDNLSNQISDKIINGESITSISNSLNLKKEDVDSLTRDYKINDTSNEIFYKSLITSSFESNKDFVSDIIILDKDLFYIVNVKNIKQSKPLGLETIENKVLIDWKNFKKSEKIIAEINKNQYNPFYLDKLSKKYSKKIKNATFSKSSKEIPYTVLDYIFNSEKNENIQSYINSIFYIASIQNIIIENIENEKNQVMTLDSDFKSYIWKFH